MNQEEKDIKFLNRAFEESNKSHAKRLKVGAIVVDSDNKFLSCGYNKMPNFMNQNECENSIEGKLVTKPELIHAEQLALMKNGLDFVKLLKGTIYVTDSPCIHCAKLIYLYGIKRVVYSRPYRLTEGIDFLRKAGVEVTQIPFEEVYNN